MCSRSMDTLTVTAGVQTVTSEQQMVQLTGVPARNDMGLHYSHYSKLHSIQRVRFLVFSFAFHCKSHGFVYLHVYLWTCSSNHISI